MQLSQTVVSHIAAATRGQYPMGAPDIALIQEVSCHIIPGTPTPQRVNEYAAHAYSMLSAGHRDSEHFI